MRVAEVQWRELSVGLEGSATVQGEKQVPLSFHIPGELKKFAVGNGLPVKKGALLAELECGHRKGAVAVAEASVRATKAHLQKVLSGTPKGEIAQLEARAVQARIVLDQAQQELERQERLSAKGLTEKKILQDAQSAAEKAQAAYKELSLRKEYLLSLPLPEDVAVARASVEEAKAQLLQAKQQARECQLFAPFAGVFIRKKEVGSFLQMGEPVGLLFSKKKYAVARLPEENRSRIRIGERVKILSSGGKASGSGKVVEVGADIDPRSRTFEVKVHFFEASPPLVPGAYLPILFVEKEKRLLSFPKAALVQGKSVFVVESGRARKRSPLFALTTPDWVGIRSGLKEGDHVVVEGQVGLRSGDRVVVRE